MAFRYIFLNHLTSKPVDLIKEMNCLIFMTILKSYAQVSIFKAFILMVFTNLQPQLMEQI